MATIEELEELYKQAKYRQIILSVANVQKLEIEDHPDDVRIFLQVAWAHHQLGEYDKSIPMMEEVGRYYEASGDIGESARRGLAHGLLQGRGEIGMADLVMQEIPPSLGRDNVRMNFFVIAARKGLEVPAEAVMAMITNALATMPYVTVNGHIINNGALVLHEAREQESVKPYFPILPGLIFTAIGIYRTTDTAKNHLAGVTFRASQICEAAGWKKLARIEAETSVELWRELVSSQGGERYRKNLEGAEAQLKKLTK